MGYAIQTHNLTKVYRHHRTFSDLLRPGASGTKAVNGVSIAVEEGEVFGLLGPNGSGKTTFLKLLSTIVSPTSGTASILGLDVVRDSRQLRQMISLTTGEERSFYWRLTARQNLNFFAKLYELDDRAAARKVDEVLDLFDLAHVGNVNVSEFSTGMKQRLAIARGLLNTPKLLFLDEPTRGLDPLAAHHLLDMLSERIVDYFDNTVILTTHIMREVERLSHRVAILRQGQTVFFGTVAELSASVQTGDRYSIRVRRLAPDRVPALTTPEIGAIGAVTAIDADTVEFDVLLERNGPGLSAVLRRILDEDADVVECVKHEPSLEETFRSLFDDDATEGDSAVD